MAPACMMQVRLMVLPASMNNSLLPKIVVCGSRRFESNQRLGYGYIHKLQHQFTDDLVHLSQPAFSLLSNTYSQFLKCASCDNVATKDEYQRFTEEYGLILATPDFEDQDICLPCFEKTQKPEIQEPETQKPEKIQKPEKTQKPKSAQPNKMISDFIRIIDPPSPYFKCEKCKACRECKSLETIASISLREQKEEKTISDELSYDAENKTFVSGLPSISNLQENIKENQKILD